MFQYLTSENIFRRFELSKTYTDSLTTPFPEYHRIGNAQPKAGLPKHLPKNTDGTTSSIIKKTPRRVVQQIPTGKINSEVNNWVSIVAGFILQERIIPNANSQYPLIEKCWQSVEGSLMRGYNPIYCPTVAHPDYIGPDWLNPWWGDIFIQPGKLSDTDSHYIFLRSWWREEDIEAKIAQIEKMSKEEQAAAGWDLDVLKEVKEHEQAKDDKAMTPTDRAQAINQRGGIELITGFQKGVEAEFLTFHRDTHSIARTKNNKDPRGKIPIIFNYCETNGTNPFGRGFVEMVAPLQNLMDSDDQMYQFNRALMLAPPGIKRGEWNKSQAQLYPNALIDLGTNPQNTLEFLKIDSSALINYPQLYQLNQSRLFQLLSSPNTNIPQGAAGIQNSKTTEGVKQTNVTLSIDDNFIRKKFESAFEAWAETAINKWFAERTGTEELQLDADTASKLRNLDGFDETTLSDDNKIRINYDDATEVLTFKVDASTSQKVADAEQVVNMQQAIPLVTPQVSYYLGQDGWNFSLGEFYTQLFQKMNIDNIDKILTKMTPQEAEEAKKQPFPIIDPPQIRLTGQVPQGAMAAALSNGGVNAPPDATTEDNPIDMGDILKYPGVPAGVVAQIIERAGLQTDPIEVENAMATDAAQHVATQAQHLASATDALLPAQSAAAPSATPDTPATQPPAGPPSSDQGNPPQFSEDDQKLIAMMRQAKVPDDKIGSAMALVHKGAPVDAVMKHLLEPAHG